MPTTAENVKPSESGSTDTQTGESGDVVANQQLLQHRLPAITGRVSDDVAGWVQADPQMMAQMGSMFFFASTHKDLSVRLDRAETRNENLAEEVGRLRAENARLQQALRDHTESQTPRALVTSLGGILTGAGIELWITGNLAVGPLLSIVGAIFIAAASWWRPSSGAQS